MNSISETLRLLRSFPEMLQDVEAGLAASEEEELEEAIRRSLITDFDHVVAEAAAEAAADAAAEAVKDAADDDVDSLVSVPWSGRRRKRNPLPTNREAVQDDVFAENDDNDDDNNNHNDDYNKPTKKMKNRKNPEAERWNWIASISDLNAIGDRHLRQTYCFNFPRCRQKPRCLRCSSPFCLHNIGEGRWDDIDDSQWTRELEDLFFPRLESKWVGLENLGGTCYINSCLQLWFHDPTIRNLLFRSDPEEDEEEKAAAAAAADPAADAPRFRSLIANLQYVFVSMLFSINGIVNARPLIDYLQIDPKTQQDFEEFSSLLRGCVESRLKTQSDPDVRHLMQNEFVGESTKGITCCKCGITSQSSETFYELILPIHGKKDLYDCLDTKFASETMSGSNQYRCGSCGLQDAVLETSIKSLPPMLCIQFMRFGFERVRQKLTDCVRFPENLDLGKYMSKDSTAAGAYELVSVLIHMGCSSKSGHYIDCIKEYGSDSDGSSKASWFTFNDGRVNGPFVKLNLSKAEEEQSKPKGRPPPGHHASSNAYILWYKRVDPASAAEGGSTVSSSPSNSSSSLASSASTVSRLEHALDRRLPWPERLFPGVREAVERDNGAFVEAFKQSEDAMVHSVADGRRRQEFVLETHRGMWLKADDADDDDFEFVSKAWLKKGFFDADKEELVETIRNKELACKHGKLDPEKVFRTKIIKKKLAEELYRRYRSEGPRFSGRAAMCEKCVREVCRKTQLKNEIETSKKEIRRLCAAHDPDGSSGCWVGKKSFTQWARLAGVGGGGGACSGEEEDPEDESGREAVPESAAAANDDPASSASRLSASSVFLSGGGGSGGSGEKPPPPQQKTISVFNEDLRCPHGRLDPQPSVRRLVPRSVWDVFLRYFPGAEEFPKDSSVCPSCADEDREAREATTIVRRVAADLKKHVGELARNEKRPDLAMLYDRMVKDPAAPSPLLHVLPRHFVSQLRRFLKFPAAENQPVSMSCVLLLCPHRRMMYDLEAQTILDSSVDLVWPHELDAIKSHVGEDARVTAKFVAGDGSSSGGGAVPLLIYDPPLCRRCARLKLTEKQSQRFEFDRRKIFVRKLGDRDAECRTDGVGVVKAHGGVNGVENGVDNGLIDLDDPEFQPGLFANGGGGGEEGLASSSSIGGSKRPASSDCEAPKAKVVHLENGDAGCGAPGAAGDCLKINGVAEQNGDCEEEGGDLSEVIRTLGLPYSFGPAHLKPAPRSRRRRNDREVEVSSTETLKDLKKRIFAEFQIAAFDQNLFFDENKVRLEGDERTLGDLGVTPECLILVRGDKPGDSSLCIAVEEAKEEEEERGPAGFSGTRLVNGGWS